MAHHFKAIPAKLSVLILSAGLALLLLSACGTNTDNQSTAASKTVEANLQAGGIKAAPTVAPTFTAAAQATTTSASGGGNSTTTSASGGGNAADIQAGLQLFQQNGCSGCHSNDGKAAGVGPKLQGDPNVTGTAFVINQVRNKAVAPMPKFPVSQISDADLNKIAAYIVSLQGK